MDDLAGLSVSHPGVALLMVLFLFSLIGMPLTAGFWAQVASCSSARMDVPPDATPSGSQSLMWFIILAVDHGRSTRRSAAGTTCGSRR